jgi:diadenylate cyclase
MLARLLENIWLTVQQVRGLDLIDMLLVWGIVYRVLLLIKQTRAVQVLSGLGILSITFILSISLELSTINWLLDKFFANLFVIVVILFQNEIRKALAHIGRNPFFTGVSSAEETLVLDEIAKTAVLLAQKRLGALIVLEREISLDDFIELGTPLDANVSSEIINALFLPASPLHDGAVIIRQGRVHSAGSFLPLTKNPDVNKNLGTRHRAAIGLTEETDAVVLVVSEENNQVGIVIGGQLTQDVDLSTLRRTLYSVFNLQEKYTRSADRGVTT